MPKKEFMLAKSLKNQSCHMVMLFDGLRQDENVVEVDTDHSFHNEILEYVVHHRLEGRGGISESEKNITKGLNSPQLVQNAAFHSSPSFICTLLYPHHTLSFVKNFAPHS
jgi:hypothetical protein